MIRTVVIADDDDLVGRLEVDSVDLLISLGDLADSTIEKAYLKYRPAVVYAVRGNHDTPHPFPGFVINLHNRVEEFQGVPFGGLEGSWKYKAKGHYLYEQEEVSGLLRAFSPVDVLISHNSPRGYHERDRDIHQGFDGLLEYIERFQPRYVLHGHQHLSKVSRIGKTDLIGVFGESSVSLDY